MVVKYDRLNRFETPMMTLCNPGSEYNNGTLTKVIGILTDISDAESVFNFNATSELNFRVNDIDRENDEDNAHVKFIYNSIENRRLLFLDGLGYYAITNVDKGYDGSVHYKDVTASSIEKEIEQKMIPYIENNTYRFSSNQNNKGILETIIETIPLWQIGYVDSAIAEKFRTFEDVDVNLNCLSFMITNLQDAYECIILFDCINRVVNVYDQNNYVRETSIHITEDDLINNSNVSANADDLYTAINVLGDSDITISAINPLGTNVIYDFSYYLDWMTPSLSQKVSQWQEEIEDCRSEYYDLNNTLYELLADKSNYDQEVNKLKTQITMYQRCKENVVAEKNASSVGKYNEAIKEAGGKEIDISDDISELIKSINDLINECQDKLDETNAKIDDLQTQISEQEAAIKVIRDSVSIDSYFTAEELEELSFYIFEGEYRDEYVVITDIMTYDEQFEQMKILYDRAKTRLDKVSKPTVEYTFEVENFIFVKDFEHFSNQLETGCLINVEVGKDDVALLFLSNITINYEDNTLNMTFGNRFNKFDPKSLFDDVLGNISKSANTLNYIKEILYPVKDGEFNAMREALQTSRDLTMGAALASTDEEVVIDGSGYTGRKRDPITGELDPRQIKITGQNIVFTDDSWESSKLAIGNLILGDGSSIYGINAEAIFGDVIMGNNLHIIDDNGNDIFSVMNDMISTQIGDLDIEGIKTQIKQTSDYVEILISEGDPNEIITTNGYRFSSDGLHIYESGSDIENTIDNTGMFVDRVTGSTRTNMLAADSNGVRAINLTSSQYLIVGKHCRFENFSYQGDNKRTACFYIDDE